MKKHNDAVEKKTLTTNPPDPERRKITKQIAALTLLGMGLGVNLEQAFAGLEKPPVDYWKHENPKPGVSIDKAGISKPAVSQDKTHLSTPSADMIKFDKQPNAPVRPGATRVKPIPAAIEK
jgi:hypothetical protein